MERFDFDAPDDRSLAGVRQTAAAVREGRLLAADVVARALDAARADDRGAWTALDPDGATSIAAAIDARVRAGEDPGPLAGITVAVKDVIDVAGLPTSLGVAGRTDPVAAFDATCVRRVRAAGAIVLGKARTSPLAWEDDTPPAVNPLDDRLSTGGSSGGSAVCVAGGLAQVGLGTDTGGSVRWPAAMCGLVGHRPTLGVVGRGGLAPGSVSLDTIGPIVRSVADARALLAVLAGHDPADPGSADPDVLADLARRLATPGPPVPVASLQLGLVRHGLLEVLDDEVRAAHGALEARLTAAGATLVDVPLPALDRAVSAIWAISLGESGELAAHVAADEERLLRSHRVQLRLGRMLPESAIEAARVDAGALRAAALEAFDAARLDALVLPASPLGPAVRGAPAPQLPEGHGGRTGSFYVASLTGQPAVVVPLRRGPRPLGVQLLGRPFGDDALLAVAEALESLLADGA